ncbi:MULTISPECIES: hypothetical protein [unclassified Pseudoalteromonas]|uniref:hypothetical protein n=1 Tax=unclassified Pseudoalteromonas TaxID=194690 RepID=UPI003014AE97
MNSLFKFALFTIIIAMLLATVTQATIIQVIVLSSLILLLFLSKKDVNSQLLTLIFASIFVAETCLVIVLKYMVLPATDSYFEENIYLFGTQLIVSLSLLLLLRSRMTVSVLITRGKSAPVFEKNHAEGPLLFLVLLMVFIDFCALAETLIRNLEVFGIKEELAKAFWELTFFFDYFEYLKAVPMLLCVMMLYVGLIVRTKSHQLQS